MREQCTPSHLTLYVAYPAGNRKKNTKIFISAGGFYKRKKQIYKKSNK